jgi:hypothetical protein
MSQKSLTDPFNPDLLTLQGKVARRREYLDLLELELRNTRGVIMEFTQLYAARITPLETRHRQLSEMLEQLNADQAPPDSEWKGSKRRVNGNSHASQNGHSAENGHKRDDTKKPKKAPTDSDPDYERKIRELFRRLAKQHHPDLAQAEEDKKRREELMADINQAYSAKDLDALEELAKQSGDGLHWAGLEGDLARLNLELRQLDAMIFDVEQTIREMDLSPAMQMRSEMRADRETGRDYLSEIEAEYRARILELHEKLLSLGADLDLPVSSN